MQRGLSAEGHCSTCRQGFGRGSGEAQGIESTWDVQATQVRLSPECSDKKVPISGRGAGDRAGSGKLTLTAGWQAHW